MKEQREKAECHARCIVVVVLAWCGAVRAHKGKRAAAAADVTASRTAATKPERRRHAQASPQGRGRVQASRWEEGGREVAGKAGRRRRSARQPFRPRPPQVPARGQAELSL